MLHSAQLSSDRRAELSINECVVWFVPVNLGAALQKTLHLVGKLAARNQHPPFTSQADHADIRAGAVNLPLYASTGMGLAQLDYIPDVNLIVDFHSMDKG